MSSRARQSVRVEGSRSGSGSRPGLAKSRSESEAEAEAQEALYKISQLMETGLDRTSLRICVSMIDQGVPPETLATAVKELMAEAAAAAAAATKR
ncbi:mitotic-spindle organizing protein [Phaffia rhodozyma]|uniref:Mitotic-spindle organizing protein 1 n=1 Tax=Phaffia rhodozyma TaxID=264483 RepID=A0A0F7SHL2_PHARH|nr:mitotic-spindle organizing protein [Phaffia rhodozyma]